MSKLRLYAFIDEAGQRSRSPRSSDHFVMSAVMLQEEDTPDAEALLAKMRAALGRRPGDILHWRNLQSHTDRLFAAQQLGQAEWLHLATIVVCKRHIWPSFGVTDDSAYLYTLRLLLERMSWLARDCDRILEYTLAHIVRFRLATLRADEAALRMDSNFRIAWNNVDPRGGQLDQPSRVELLQLADTAASATFRAFEKDKFSNTEPRYLREMAPRFYRGSSGVGNVARFGVKLLPTSGTTKAAYPWVAAL